jgi:tRNA-2-methylthio-N6-dimethylallyladenosine synthase
MSKKVYIESYGCQMNVSDSEVVASILAKEGYETATSAEEADLVLLNTCSVREKAEYTVMQRINEMNRLKAGNKDLKVGVLGCMAERMKENLLVEKKVVDLVVGPDAYRSLPQLLDDVGSGQRAVNVLLSREETYGEIVPVRLNSNGVTAFVTIMRGCDNMCAFCVVPFTRGRERSRDAHSIVAECKQLVADGYKEVTLLGQNVDSYKYTSPQPLSQGEGLPELQAGVAFPPLSPGEGPGVRVDFADLLEMVALACPTLRIRYSTSHPKDMTDKVLEVMAKYGNICKYIHLPVQSGSSAVLKKMNRGYDRAWYMDRIAAIRRYMPDCAISTDIISGFCGETDEDHKLTLDLMAEVGYDMAFMFKYSERPKTLAARKHPDDVPEETKSRRLAEIIEAQKRNSAKRMASYVGQVHEVLIEGVSKRSAAFMYGRNTQNSVVIVPRFSSKLSVDSCQAAMGGEGRHESSHGDLTTDNQQLKTSASNQLPVGGCQAAMEGDCRDEGSVPDLTTDNQHLTTKELRPGDLIKVRITSATAGSLQGEPLQAMHQTVAQA